MNDTGHPLIMRSPSQGIVALVALVGLPGIVRGDATLDDDTYVSTTAANRTRVLSDSLVQQFYFCRRKGR